ncbi:acetyltransferase family protein [Arthrobacter crystallopoietes BAB-32]|uniref:Acetyltransferase family protein n=1 Tax=Arthrobacter crystallopoietes BAB-32 TaxID=1246476 RepID=N1UUH2_9MICC|nr:GNAT family N-acetyltransferase [Arthrobacter crystallopoietes]EMY32690.1 acetyltransferase family protein [Arthrobacter crystallopoietes BAB-32]
MGPKPSVEMVEITTAAWPVFEELLGPGGVQGGCWCSWFRLTSKEYAAGDRETRKEFVRSRVDAGEPFGLVAKVDGEPLGWVSVAPRRCHVRLERSKVARLAAGENPDRLWTVACFYNDRRGRGQGLPLKLLEAALDYAAQNGAAAVEGYPVDTAGDRLPPQELYYGTLSTFLAAGFEQVERRGARRVLVRKELVGGESGASP